MQIIQTILNFAGPLGIGAILGIVIQHFLEKDRIKTEIILKDKLKAYKLIIEKIESIIFAFKFQSPKEFYSKQRSFYFLDFCVGDAMFYLSKKITLEVEKFALRLAEEDWVLGKDDIKKLELIRNKIKNQIRKELKIKC